MFALNNAKVSYMFIVPHLRQHRFPRVCAILSCFRRIVTRPGASDKRDTTMLFKQGVADVSVRIRCAIRRRDIRGLQPVERRKALVVLDRRLKKVHDVLMFTVLWAIARRVERRETCSMFAELMAPEPRIILVLRNPVCVHILQQILLAKWLQEGTDVGSRVGWNEGAIRRASRGVWRRDRIVLAVKIAVLRVAAVTVVRP